MLMWHALCLYIVVGQSFKPRQPAAGNERESNMIVKVYEIGESGEEVFLHHSELSDCFPDSEDELESCRYELNRQGRCWVGGGAAALFLLTVIAEARSA